MSSIDPKLIAWFRDQRQAQSMSDLARRLAAAERNAGQAASSVFTELSSDINAVSAQVTSLAATALSVLNGNYDATVGVDYLTWGGGFATATNGGTAHGLGRTPSFVLLTPQSQSGTGPITMHLASPPGSSTFSTYGCTVPVGSDPGYVPPGGTSVPFGWIAIG